MYEDWLKEQLEGAPHGTKGKLAEHMGLDGPKLSKTLKGDRELTARELERAVDFFGRSPQAFRKRATTQVVGKAGAATDGRVVYSIGSDNLGEVYLPEGAPPESVAIEVEGYSMGVLADGALVFYTESETAPTEDMLGLVVIVGTSKGDVLLKKLLRGSKPGLYDLESINGPTLRDQKIAWAAHIDSLVPPWRAKRLRVHTTDVTM